MRRFVGVSALLVLGLGGVAAGMSAASGGAGPTASEATTRVTVIATDFKFRLSKQRVPTGIVIFTVVNRGKIAHDFKIAGKKTRLLAPGKRVTLRVKISKKGRYGYICTLPGHAAAGMKGVLAVGSEATTRVTVIATDFKFRLSKQRVPTGIVIFTVVNRGKIAHDFKIAGKKTRLLAPGKRVTLRVNISKKGRYGYICTLPGHAAAGMKGVLAVGSEATTTGTTTTTGTNTTGTTTTVPGPSTTISVDMFEYRFELFQSTVPTGTITFVITNKGREPHNFDVGGVKAGAILAPGQSETWTVGLTPKTYALVCDVPFHIDFGMVGELTVN